MVTFAQAQERAEEWINGDVPGYQHREVRVREFELGFVVWAEDRENGPVSDGGSQRLVIARDSGDATLWPGLPVGEVIRRYEEEYGAPDVTPEDAAPAPPERVDLNQTSFLLSPPEWLQEAADKLGIPDRRGTLLLRPVRTAVRLLWAARLPRPRLRRLPRLVCLLRVMRPTGVPGTGVRRLPRPPPRRLLPKRPVAVRRGPLPRIRVRLPVPLRGPVRTPTRIPATTVRCPRPRRSSRRRWSAVTMTTPRRPVWHRRPRPR